MFLKNEKTQKESLYYQIFIEPKGKQFSDINKKFELGKEGWKETFLKEISDQYGLGGILKAEDPHYNLIGLPFYNKASASTFEEKYKELYREK